MRRFAAPLTGLVLAVLAREATAAEWRAAGDQPLPSSTVEATASHYVDAAREELGLTGVDLVQTKTLPSPKGFATVRFEQRYQGFRVVDRAAAVRVASPLGHGASGRVQASVVDVARDLTVSVSPDIDDVEATEVVSTSLGTSVDAQQAQLAVLGRGHGILVWMIDVRDGEGGKRYMVDAHSAKVVDVWARGASGAPLLGRIYHTSSVITPTPTDEPLDTLDTTAVPILLNGWDGNLTVTNYVNGSSQAGFDVVQVLIPNDVQGFLYDPPLDPLDITDGFAQVNLFFHLTNMRAFYTNLGIDQTASSWKLTAVANAEDDHQPLDNAFYSGQGQDGPFASPNLIAIGQGSISDFSYDSDVFKHEFGHYVTANTVNYNLGDFHNDSFGLSPFSGAIDEGIADYFACSANADPILGEASLGPLGAERDLSDATKTCPSSMVGESHADGEIIGSLGWTIRTALGADKADAIMWGAITTLTPGASFGDFGRGLTTSVQSMVTAGTATQADADQVAGFIADRGLDHCDPVVPIEGTATESTFAFGLDLLSQFTGQSCEDLASGGIALPGLFNFSRDTATTDSGVTFHVQGLPTDGAGDVVLKAFVRKGQHVGFEPGQGGFLPEATQFDTVFDIAGIGDVVIDSTTMPAFVPGQTYFISVTSSSCPSVLLDISASNQTGGPATTSSSESTSVAASTGSGSGAGGGGGATGGDEEVSGGACHCVVAAEPIDVDDARNAALLGLGLVGASVLRRRSSRRDAAKNGRRVGSSRR